MSLECMHRQFFQAFCETPIRVQTKFHNVRRLHQMYDDQERRGEGREGNMSRAHESSCQCKLVITTKLPVQQIFRSMP